MTVTRNAALAAVLLTALWSTSGAIDSVDAKFRLRVAEQLVTEGGLTVASHGSAEDGSLFRDAAGTYPSKYGIGQSLFFLPFVAGARALTAVAPVPDRIRPRVARLLVATSVYAFILLATGALCFATARALGAEPLPAGLVAFVAVFGSSFWAMAKHGQEENQLALAVLLAGYGHLAWSRTQRARYVWLSAVAVGIATIFRPTAITIVLGVVGAYLVSLLGRYRRGALQPEAVRQVAACFLVAGAGAVAIVLGYNWFKTGHPLHFGYATGSETFSGDWLDGFRGSLFGLDRGIVWRNPWLLPAAALTAWNWRRLGPELRGAVALAGFLLLSSVALYSSWSSWSGGVNAYGTRFQQHVVPLLAVALLLGALQPLRRPRWWTSRAAVGLALAAAAFQLPSVAFVHNLEAIQAEAAGATAPRGEHNTVGMGGQLHLRHRNVVAKLATGAPVPFDTLESKRPLVPLLVDSSRWDFWPWRLEDYLGRGAARPAAVAWAALLLLSIGAWLVVFLRARRETDA